MLTEETHAAGVADKVTSHEDAAHEKRNWVRLTFDCNDHCVFCLDSDAHDGDMRDRDDVKRQILEGRRAGATRLILSGGEPTIHPNYVDFVRLGRQAGYPKIQTVTNGRMFSYGDFLERCLDAGLSEITFSLHGPNAKVHDALVGTKGRVRGGDDGAAQRARPPDRQPGALPIVNVDIVVNRGNVKHAAGDARALLRDGRAGVRPAPGRPLRARVHRRARHALLRPRRRCGPHIQEALAYSKRPDVHIWMNRFPPQHLEGYEHLIQDPYKLNDEVRGRKEEYARLLDDGIWLSCREPARCKYCYLERLCDTLEGVIETVDEKRFDVVRVDAAWEAKQPKAFGGDPASARRSKEEAARKGEENGNGKRALPPVRGEGAAGTGDARDVWSGRRRRRRCSCARRAWREAAELASRFPGLMRVELELDDYTGLEAALADALRGREVVRVGARSRAQAEALLALDAAFEVTIDLTKETAAWLLALPAVSPRVALRQPNYERLTEASANDVDLREFFARFRHDVPVENVPACILGRAPRDARKTLDTAMMTPDGRLEIFRYTRRYILEGYRTKSLRCVTCVHVEACAGMHINYVRAHGYAVMEPIAG